MIDTYWSDHCRHTTFGTILDDVQIDDAVVQEAFDRYLAMRSGCWAGRTSPCCLMDLATIGAKELKKQGILKNLDESDEINACTVKINVRCQRQGGGLAVPLQERDAQPPDGDRAVRRCCHLHRRCHPRSAVRPQLCLSGHARHRCGRPAGTRQRDAARQAAPAQAGDHRRGRLFLLTATRSAWRPVMVDEIYHPGYVAKRMEIGAVVGAAPAANVRRECPAPGDVVVLLGGRTGRDGCGGATGSSKAHKLESLETLRCRGAEGQRPRGAQAAAPVPHGKRPRG